MPADGPILVVDDISKVYKRGFLKRRKTFSLWANFAFDQCGIVGVLGPNGSGKTTLFEILAGSNRPDGGRVLCRGQDIHRVKYRERDRVAIHYHQSHQVRRFKRTRPSFMLEPAKSAYPIIHLFDEPQFNTQDGYIGFMLDFFRKLREEGRLVFISIHPREPFHLEILREICECYIFVLDGGLHHAPDFQSMLRNAEARRYLGSLAEPFV